MHVRILAFIEGQSSVLTQSEETVATARYSLLEVLEVTELPPRAASSRTYMPGSVPSLTEAAVQMSGQRFWHSRGERIEPILPKASHPAASRLPGIETLFSEGTLASSPCWWRQKVVEAPQDCFYRYQRWTQLQLLTCQALDTLMSLTLPNIKKSATTLLQSSAW